MTTLNTIIEEEKKRAADIFLGGENTEPEDVWHTAIYDEKKEKLDVIVTTAMQRAYKKGKADSTQENDPSYKFVANRISKPLVATKFVNTPDTEWEKWVRTLSNSTNPRDTDLLIAKIAVLLTSRDTYWKERVGDINKSFVDFMESFVENGDNEIDLESLEEWRQHTLLDNLK